MKTSLNACCLCLVFLLFAGKELNAQNEWRIVLDTTATFIYPDTLAKPVLYPVFTSTGKRVTRGFPLDTKPEDPQDHPHHVGIWMNFENVNGLDFWNNSYAIPAEKKRNYGSIKTQKVTTDKHADLRYSARWVNSDQQILINEETGFHFSGKGNYRIIDRITRFTAEKQVVFKDAKDGLMAIRVRRELQLPDTAIKGTPKPPAPTSTYLTSEGKTGNDAWGTRAKWCMLSGKLEGDSVSIAIIDHPENPGYPAYWHARDYGLFSVNPLGQNIFSKGAEQLDLSLQPGETAVFRYRIIIKDGKSGIPAQELNTFSKDFETDMKNIQ
jgi:Methane oxygenase PmoA